LCKKQGMLGEGCFGTVFEVCLPAEDGRSPDCQWVMKIQDNRTDWTKEKDNQTALLDKENLKSLIPKLASVAPYSFRETDGRPSFAIVSERMDGDCQPEDAEEIPLHVLHKMFDAAAKFDAAHYLHGDIKPDNFLYRNQGEGAQAPQLQLQNTTVKKSALAFLCNSNSDSDYESDEAIIVAYKQKLDALTTSNTDSDSDYDSNCDAVERTLSQLTVLGSLHDAQKGPSANTRAGVRARALVIHKKAISVLRLQYVTDKIVPTPSAYATLCTQYIAQGDSGEMQGGGRETRKRTLPGAWAAPPAKRVECKFAKTLEVKLTDFSFSHDYTTGDRADDDRGVMGWTGLLYPKQWVENLNQMTLCTYLMVTGEADFLQLQQICKERSIRLNDVRNENQLKKHIISQST
jgi:serine/threonine protein kinase